MTSFRAAPNGRELQTLAALATTTVHCQSRANYLDGSRGTRQTRLTMSWDERNSPRHSSGLSTNGEAGVERPGDTGDELRLLGHQERHRVCDVLGHQDLDGQ